MLDQDHQKLFFLTSWWLNHPSEKYARQIGNLPLIGMKIKHIWNHHPGNFQPTSDLRLFLVPCLITPWLAIFSSCTHAVRGTETTASRPLGKTTWNVQYSTVAMEETHEEEGWNSFIHLYTWWYPFLQVGWASIGLMQILSGYRIFVLEAWQSLFWIWWYYISSEWRDVQKNFQMLWALLCSSVK